MDEFTDLFDDSGITEDTSAGHDQNEPVEGDDGDSGGNPSLEDILKDILDGYFSADEADQEDGEETGPETDEDVEADTATDQNTDELENGEGYLIDPEILSEINNALHHHADDVSGFMSRVTVSGNAVMVSLDDASSALLEEVIGKQNAVMERMDYMSGLILMVLFVLLFDLLHRFAKRIFKNFTRGDDNKNAADS